MTDQSVRDLGDVVPSRRPGASSVEFEPRPASFGRWEPTRAGAVNSWQWVDEQFGFVAGLLAMIGHNGSGKSLTAGVLCPTFMDGDISAKALSASGGAASGLLAIHTQGRSGPPQTGVWWQEYGRVDRGADGSERERWLTVGLWLRSTGGKRAQLEVAWFIVPARVDADVVLQRDGEPVSAGDLAGQLLAHRGQVFTGSTVLEQACRACGLVTAGQDEFVEAVRRAMYLPLDRDQLDALAAILRVLRSVQAHDKLSPGAMQETLSSALPPLDASRVQGLAQSMASAEQLRQRLSTARSEQRLLGEVRDSYRRYVAAAAVRSAVDYLARSGACEQAAAKAVAVRRKADAAEAARREAEAGVQEGERNEKLLAGTVDTLTAKVQGHPGAGVQELAQAAQEAEQRAQERTRTAQEREGDLYAAQAARDQSQGEVSRRLAELDAETRSTERSALEVGGGGVVCALSATADLLRDAKAAMTTEVDAAVRNAREQASVWVGFQQQAVAETREARRALDAVVATCVQVEERHDQAQDRRAELEEQARALARAAHDAEDTAAGALAGYADGLLRLPADDLDLLRVPVDPAAIRARVQQTAARMLSELDLPGCEAHARACDQTASSAATAAHNDQQRTDRAVEQSRRQAARLAEAVRGLADPPPAVNLMATQAARATEDAGRAPGDVEDQNGGGAGDAGDQTGLLVVLAREAAGALTGRQDTLRQADTALRSADGAQERSAVADAEADEAGEAAARARQHAQALGEQAADIGRTWAGQVHQWAADLQVLDRSGLRLPKRKAPDPAGIEPLQQDLGRAHLAAVETLTGQLAGLGHSQAQQQSMIDDLDDQITQARRTEPGPAQPAWRPSRDGRLGAPLWQVVDFADGLTTQQAGLVEGALLAVGLLDAWVCPDGTVTAGDLSLVPGPRRPGATLADWLVPDKDAPVPAARIKAVLAGVSVDQTGGDCTVLADGTVRIGPLAAASPAGWRPRYIGAAARERARQRLLADLGRRRDGVAAELARTQTQMDEQRACLVLAETECRLPDPAPWLHGLGLANDAACQAQLGVQAAQAAERIAGEARDRAAQARQQAVNACAGAKVEPALAVIAAAQDLCGELHSLLAGAAHAADTAVEAAVTSQATYRAAELAATASRDARIAWGQARDAAAQVTQDLDGLPVELDHVQPARAAAEAAQAKDVDAARVAAEAEHELAGQRELVRQGSAALHECATKTAVPLPTDLDGLAHRHRALTGLDQALRAWSDCASSAWFAYAQAASLARGAEEAGVRAGQARAAAEAEAAAAATARHKYAEEQRTHDAPYRQLVDDLLQTKQRLTTVQEALADHRKTVHDAEIRLAVLDAGITEVHTAQEEAVTRRDEELRTLQELFDRRLADELADDGALHRPEDPMQADSVARLILTQRGTLPELTPRLALDEEHGTRGQVEKCVRELLPQLMRVGLRVACEDVPGTRWRHVLVSPHQPDHPTSGTQPLRDALQGATLAAVKLGHDFNEKVQHEVKGVVFSELRRDINVRIHLAEEIVKSIRGTLKDVRTGEQQVGIRLTWMARSDDPLAAKAISLIRDADPDGGLDAMYEFFVAQLKAEDGK